MPPAKHKPHGRRSTNTRGWQTSALPRREANPPLLCLLPPLHRNLQRPGREPLRLKAALLLAQTALQFSASIHRAATETLVPAKGRGWMLGGKIATSFSSGVSCPRSLPSSHGRESPSPLFPPQGKYQKHWLAQLAATVRLYCIYIPT